MINQLYIINGSATVGKDSFVKAYSGNTVVVNYSSIALVKKIGKLCGIDVERKTEEVRKWLSDTKMFLTEHGDIPFKDCCSAIQTARNSPTSLSMFLHVREPWEIAKFKEKFPEAITLLIRNDRVRHIVSNDGDANVFNYKYDIEVLNNGTLDELNNTANALFKYAEKGKSIIDRPHKNITDNRAI